ASITRRHPRPRGTALHLSVLRDDLDSAALAVLDRRFPQLALSLAADAPPGADGRSDRVPSPHPAGSSGEAVDHWPNGVQQMHPEPGNGCNQRAGGVQPARPRGAAVAPRTIHGTIRGTVRRLRARACGAARSGRVLQRAGRDVLLRARPGLAADRPPAGPGLVGRWAVGGSALRHRWPAQLVAAWPMPDRAGDS